jgi:hypothetical protein
VKTVKGGNGRQRWKGVEGGGRGQGVKGVVGGTGKEEMTHRCVS